MKKLTHEIKCHPQYFKHVKDGSKTFEIRKNDRDYKVGDLLLIKEFDPAKGWPMDGKPAALKAEITYMTDYAQVDGYVVLGIKLV